MPASVLVQIRDLLKEQNRLLGLLISDNNEALSVGKIPVSQFCLQTGKNARQVRRLWKKHTKLKCKVAGEKECRIYMSVWNKVKHLS
jgi:hypothetical protein